jgi:alpha-beta hydrolase superfamily lysophospholipase
MIFEEAWLTTDEGIKLFARRYKTLNQPKALILLVHGFLEHSGRYEGLCQLLSSEGFEVAGADLRGHGRSEGPRVWVQHFNQYLEDLNLVWNWARNGRDSLPMFFLGHSMGGLITAWWSIEHPGQAAGIILSAPAVQIGRVFPLLQPLAGLVAWIAPRLKVVRLGASGLSRDPKVVADFLNDPLVYHDRIPVQTGAEILRSARRLRRRCSQLLDPLLILHGTADRVCELRGSIELIRRAGSRDKTLVAFPDLYHDLFHEPEAAEVISDLLWWLFRQTRKRKNDLSQG